MKTSELYKKKINCCGCGACAEVCPRSIIRMNADEEGFLYPSILDDIDCIACKRCIKVCPVKNSHTISHNPISNMAGYAKDIAEVQKSASGGLVSTLCKAFIENGGVVYGVKYNNAFSGAEYAKCSKIADLELLRGSKYIQSVKGDIYSKIKKELEFGCRVLMVGLPCEIAAMYRYIGNKSELFYSIALICHGPTSPKIQKIFSDNLSECYNSSITEFSVRHKKTGWKPYYIKATFANGSSYTEQFNKTDYNTAFLHLKRPSCNYCGFKLGGANGIPADLIAGDFHLASKGMKEYNQWGSSQVSVMSAKGAELIETITSKFNLYNISEKQAIKYNLAIFKPYPKSLIRNRFSSAFTKDSLSAACNLKSLLVYNKMQRLRTRMLSILTTIIKKLLFR